MQRPPRPREGLSPSQLTCRQSTFFLPSCADLGAGRKVVCPLLRSPSVRISRGCASARSASSSVANVPLRSLPMRSSPSHATTAPRAGGRSRATRRSTRATTPVQLSDDVAGPLLRLVGNGELARRSTPRWLPRRRSSTPSGRTRSGAAAHNRFMSRNEPIRRSSCCSRRRRRQRPERRVLAVVAADRARQTRARAVEARAAPREDRARRGSRDGRRRSRASPAAPRPCRGRRSCTERWQLADVRAHAHFSSRSACQRTRAIAGAPRRWKPCRAWDAAHPSCVTSRRAACGGVRAARRNRNALPARLVAANPQSPAGRRWSRRPSRPPQPRRLAVQSRRQSERAATAGPDVARYLLALRRVEWRSRWPSCCWPAARTERCSMTIIRARRSSGPRCRHASRPEVPGGREASAIAVITARPERAVEHHDPGGGSPTDFECAHTTTRAPASR